MNTFLLRTATLASLLLAALAPAAAADGDLLPGFGTDAEFPGMGFYPSPYAQGEDAYVQRVDGLPDGSLALIGYMNTGGNVRRASVYRLTSAGYPDHDFGDAGLRTYPMPCPNADLADASVDAGRIWLAFRGCGDFIAYRLTAQGEMDTSLLGSGLVQIAFDLGGDNDDALRRILPDGAGGLILAGNAVTANGRHLALAHITEAGLPQPGFGVNGTVTVAIPEPSIRVLGLHRMEDGRIVAVGDFAPNPTLSVLMLVRVQASGAVDAGFGNHGPGVSRADMAALLGQGGRAVRHRASLLERGGAVLGAGDTSYGVNASADFTLVKWRADGQLDQGIGAHGFRRYALDFAGPDPVNNDYNNDSAYLLQRQGDGKLLLVGRSRADDNHMGLSLLRLRRDLTPDPQFGTLGRVRHVVPLDPGGHHFASPGALLLQPGRIVLTGQADIGPAMMQMAMALENDLLFADTFD